jgi:hypothetical protein
MVTERLVVPPAATEALDIPIIPDWKALPVPLPIEYVLVPVPVPVPVQVPVPVLVLPPKFLLPLQAVSSASPAHAIIDNLRMSFILARRRSALVEI